MIKCRLINANKPLHLSKHTEPRYTVVATKFYMDKAKESDGDFIGVFRLDPIITPTKEYGDFIIMKFQTPSISPTPGLLSLEYDMIEDFLKDWEILGVYDIFDHPEDLKTEADDTDRIYGHSWMTKEVRAALGINNKDDTIIDI